MTNRLGSAQAAFLLVLMGATLRLLENFHPAFLPNFTPCVALAFVAAAYLPHRWSWLLGLAAVLLSEAAFLPWNLMSEGRMFSSFSLFSFGFYAVMGGCGALLPRRSLALLVAGPILGSILFYVTANTYCWWTSFHLPAALAYPPNFTGWLQANSTGLPGYAPTWIFLRNGIVADVIFTLALVAFFEPSLFARTFAGPKRADASVTV